MSSPKITVILTSFNHEKYLQEAIDSVLNQTFTDFELIIWDDASSDNSWHLIKQYSDPRIKAFRNEVRRKGGWGINKAISEVATGEYIAIHHSDDVWELNKLEKQAAFLDAHLKVGAVFTYALAIGEDSSPLPDEKHFYSNIFDQPNRTRHEWLRHFFTRGNALCHPSVLIRKSCYEDCGLYRYYGFAQVGDFDMWIRLCLKHEIYVLPEKLVRFRVRVNEANASGNRAETRIRGDYEFYKLLPSYRKIKKFDDLVKVFPGAKKYFRNKETDTEFALAMVALEEKPFIFTELFGLELLFEAIIDPKRSANIKRLYDFDYKSFIALTAQHDVFSREVKENLWRTLSERDGEIVNLNQTLSERDGKIVNLNQTLSERDGKIVNLNQTLSERDGKIVNLNQTLSERDGKIVNLNQTLSERDVQIANLNQVVAERDSLIGGLGQTIESLVIDRDSQKAGFEQLQGAYTKLARDSEEQVMELNRMIAARDNLLEEFKTQLSTVYKSRSWRLTSPLRWLVRKVSRIGSIINNSYANLKKRSSQDQQTLANGEVQTNAASGEDKSRFRILLVSHYCPSRAHAGGLRMLDIYALIRQQCPNVQLDLLTFHRPSIDWSLDDVYRIFHNVYLSPTEELTPEGLLALRGYPLRYDVIDLQFHQSGYQIDAFRRIGAKIIFTPMESLAKVAYINLRTNLLTTNSPRLLKLAASLRSAAEEVVFAFKADAVVCVSRADSKFLRAMTFSRRVQGVDTGVSQFEFAEALAPNYVCASAQNRRCNVLYVAYFGSETNVSALRWYLDKVHPIVKARVPGYVLTVIGRGDMSAFSGYKDNSIEFVGEVPAIALYIQEARIGIAPALSGSGFRGKVNQYAILGVPSVISPLAHNGLAYLDGKDIFVAEKPEVFADRCIQLLTDLELNDRMGQAARELCLAKYSWQSKWPTIREIYNLDKEEDRT